MAIRSNNSAKTAIFGVLIVTGVVVFLYVFYFILGITWMVYVLVISVFIMMIARKAVSIRKHSARTAAGSS
jgi:uncharacterized membrane protein